MRWLTLGHVTDFPIDFGPIKIGYLHSRVAASTNQTGIAPVGGALAGCLVGISYKVRAGDVQG